MPDQTPGGRTVETAKEARAGERGPSMLVVLGTSIVGAAVLLGILWFFFLRATH